MDIHQISETSGVSIRKLRKLDKMGVLKLDKENEDLSKIRFYISKGQSIPALQLLYLVENPDDIFELGNAAGEAQSQVDALAIGEDSAAPVDVCSVIDLAAARDRPDEVERLCDWLLGILPADPVPYSFIAVRVLLGASLSTRALIAARLPKALLNVRALPRFAAGSKVIKIKGRNATLYQKPFDL